MRSSCSSAARPEHNRPSNIFQFAALSLALANLAACSGPPGTTLTTSTAAQSDPHRKNTGTEPSELSTRYVKTQSLPTRVYITNLLNNTVTTYKANGGRTVPTIRSGINSPRAVAVDAHGKIYVVNDGDNSVTTYRSNGVRTTPTIKGLNSPIGIAVDARGNIFVTNYGDNTLRTYNASGNSIGVIKSGLNKPYGVAVDANGRVYVTNFGANNLTTYRDGTRTRLTIKRIYQPTGVAVDSNGKIYVASLGNNMLLTYTMNGEIGHPIITTGIGEPLFVTVNAQHDIYVVNYAPPPPYPPDVAVYSQRGKSKFNIATGLNGPVGVAISNPGS